MITCVPLYKALLDLALVSFLRCFLGKMIKGNILRITLSAIWGPFSC